MTLSESCCGIIEAGGEQKVAATAGHNAWPFKITQGERREATGGKMGREEEEKGVGGERELNRERLRYSVFQKGQKDLRKEKKRGEGGWGGILEDEWPRR